MNFGVYKQNFLDKKKVIRPRNKKKDLAYLYTVPSNNCFVKTGTMGLSLEACVFFVALSIQRVPLDPLYSRWKILVS